MRPPMAYWSSNSLSPVPWCLCPSPFSGYFPIHRWVSTATLGKPQRGRVGNEWMAQK